MTTGCKITLHGIKIPRELRGRDQGWHPVMDAVAHTLGVSSKLLMTSHNLSEKIQMAGFMLAVDWIKDAVSMINEMEIFVRDSD